MDGRKTEGTAPTVPPKAAKSLNILHTNVPNFVGIVNELGDRNEIDATQIQAFLTALGYQDGDIALSRLLKPMELSGLEPLTPAMPLQCSTN